MYEATPILSIQAGDHTRLGAVFDGQGVNFAVFSQNATKIELCLFSPDGQRESARFALPDRTGAVWHGYVPGLRPGALYGFRAHGPYEPDRGHRFNPMKLLADPYARAFHGRWIAARETLGHDAAAPEPDAGPNRIDSAPFVPKSIVPAPETPWNGAPAPRRSWSETVIYEAHVKGLTQRHPDVPAPLRGTYEALGSDAIIAHLTDLGVTALELLPVQAFLDDGFLVERGLTNYWGYNTLGFFALEPRYFGPNGADGFRQAVDRLHRAGIEVILDVVYNHTAEGDHRGPTLSFRGLDNAAYYNLQASHARHYVNDTGCGNTVAASHPFVLRMVLDSLRYWVTVMGIDGFRFDLATTLGREPHGFDPRGGFFDAIRQDPVLSRCKLMAEPWDIGPGGYQLGGFPSDWGEWNDRFRDSARRFWRGDAHAAQELAGNFLGTASVFDRAGRKPFSSVNFVAAHDGFTLADVTRYRDKHNEANGESNADGHGHNLSDNCGVEGDTTDGVILARRARRARNLLATLFLSQGTPMLLAGDEMGHSQRGNNNTYCQDNETTWINWTECDSGLQDFARRLIALRRDNPVLRQGRYLHGRPRRDGLSDVAWSGLDGAALNWRDSSLDGFCLHIRGAAETPLPVPGSVLIAVNGGQSDERVILPDAGPGFAWERALDTAAPDAPPARVAWANLQQVSANSVVVFVAARRAQ
ncbi:MAG: glycogen debranching protein GlgX [Rhodobacteraceae bacterium]|nr:glycogen debranching protein GlgX [Paracoccaceae bacterium]